jgi:hypothetical protein
MDDSSSEQMIQKKESQDIEVREFENGLQKVLKYYNLPSEGIFVDIKQRQIVFKNVESAIGNLEDSKRINSVYISKYIAAVASGLFDAALNYLWDETVLELRKRVAQYDLSYFFDNAIRNPEKRIKLSIIDDLLKIDDSELILGAKEIDLISEIGYKHLDYIRYMRNWISAAHPNQGDITGLQLITWLETCINEVISLPISSVAVEIKKLLANIRSNIISDDEAREIATFFLDLSQEQINNLVFGFYGIYTRADSPSEARNNIHKLLPLIWGRVDEETRASLGLRYSRLVANNEQAEKTLARQFLDIVDGAQYITDDLRAIEIQIAIENLLTAHRGADNFYNEPAFARQLKRLVGNKEVPVKIRIQYVLGIVETFLSNGYGIAWNAEPIYLELIEKFNQKEALTAIISFRGVKISSRLQFLLCQKKYLELLDKVRNNISSPAAIEIIDAIKGYDASLDKLRQDTKLNKKVDNIITIIKS